MAKVSYGGLMTDLNGSIGSSVFTKNRFGNYVRNKVIPINRNTDAQHRIKQSLSTVARHWGVLTKAQRLQWHYLALRNPQMSRGRSITLTGFLFFSKLCRNLQEIGEPILTNIVEIGEPQAFDTFSVDTVTTPGTEDIKLNLSPAIGADNKVIVYATDVLKNGEDYVGKDRYRKLCVLDHTFVSGGSIKSSYEAVFGGMPITGEKVKFQIKSVLIASGYSGLGNYDESIATV